MIYLHKILPLFLSPLFVALSLAVWGAFRRKYTLCLIAAGILYVCSLPIVAENLFRLVENRQTKSTVESLPSADAVVVLSGMLITLVTDHGEDHEWQDPDRFFAGLKIYNLNKADKLIFTGGKLPWVKSSLSEGQILKQLAIEMGAREQGIDVTSEVETTAGEAAAVKKLLAMERPHVILVTSAFHMPRARYLFEASGIAVTAFPVDFQIPMHSMTALDFMPQSKALDLTERASRELIGRLYYRLKLPIQAMLFENGNLPAR